MPGGSGYDGTGLSSVSGSAAAGPSSTKRKKMSKSAQAAAAAAAAAAALNPPLDVGGSFDEAAGLLGQPGSSLGDPTGMATNPNCFLVCFW